MCNVQVLHFNSTKSKINVSFYQIPMYKYNSCVTTYTRPKQHIIQMYNCFTPTPLHITLHTPSADLGQHPNPPFPPSLICTICSAQSSSHEINLVHKFYSVWVPLSVLDIDPVYISFWGSLGFGSDRPNFPTKNMRVLPFWACFLFHAIGTSPHMEHFRPYLIFVIFFTLAQFLENKIYTKKRQFFALKLFRAKSVENANFLR